MMRRRCRSPKDRGAALVLVLSTIAFMAMIAVAAMDATMMGLRRTQNQVEQAQARWYLAGAEAFAAGRLQDLLKRNQDNSVDQAEWQAKPFTFPLDDGALTLTLFDGGNCFNLNSLVAVDEGGRQAPNPSAQVQLARLLDFVDARSENAVALGAALTDWIDADSIPVAGGAEDEAYGGAEARYRVANTALVDLGELTRIRGFTPAVVGALRPHVCVRPTNAATVLNPNTLTPDQAGLLSALVGQNLPPSSAEALIRARPRGGWPTLEAFFAEPAVISANLSEGGRMQFDLTPRYFVATMSVQHRGAYETGAALFDARGAMRVVRRVYGASARERVL